MPAVPDDLRRRFQKWDANGRPSQEAFEWQKKNWEKYLGNSSILEALPNPIDRAGVLETFKRVHDTCSALDAYVASYLWGYAIAGFGPYRAERVIRLNTDLGTGKHFAVELHTLAQIAMADGGTAAFEHVVHNRQADRKFFAQWGPAFATKFISFATQASDQVATTPILDSVVARWFKNHCTEIGHLWLTWYSASSYRRYTECMAEWAEDLGIEPEQVEQLIFRRAERGCQWPVVPAHGRPVIVPARGQQKLPGDGQQICPLIGSVELAIVGWVSSVGLLLFRRGPG
jgi:hypothetical protein